MKFITYIFCLLLLIFIQSTKAQKVAVVLSGGGSKGIAHIGVLKALEDNNIPIDYIAGTSMGAIVGGMYACGYSPDEIEKIITSENFQEWAIGKIDEKYNYFFQQKSPNAGWISFKFKFDSIWHPSMPTNLISPFVMDFMFMEILSAANSVSKYDFDSLYVPFRCVASDLVAAQGVIFKKGDIAQAVRASMTYPFYFQPIKIDGKYMFDGGLYNNFPADVAYNDFYPDIIIGSSVVSHFTDLDKDNIPSQIKNMIMSKTNFSTICENGILIEPKVEKTSLTDFSKSKSFIDSGYVATIRAMDEINLFVKNKIDKQTRKIKRDAFNQKKAPFIIDNIIINGLDQNQFEYVNRKLKNYNFTFLGKTKNKKAVRLSLEEIKLEYFKLIADKKIDYIYPKLIYNDISRFYDLEIEVKREKSLITEFGGVISSKEKNEAFAQLEYTRLGKRATSIVGNLYFGRFYISTLIHGRIDFPNKNPFYLSTDLTFSQWDYFKSNNTFFEDKTPSYLIQYETFWNFNLGFPVKNTGKIEIGTISAHLVDEYYQTNLFSRLDTADKTTFNMISPYFRYERSTLNRKQYSNKGSYLLFSIKHTFGQEVTLPGSTSKNISEFKKYHEWTTLRFQYENYFKSYKRFKLGFLIDVLLSNQNTYHNYVATALATPAYQPFPESKTLFLPNFRANNYGGFGLITIFNIYKSLDLRLENHIFQPYRELTKLPDNTAKYGDKLTKRYFISSYSFVYSSPIGPVSLSFNYYQKKDEPISIIFNFGYTIFNKKASE